MSPAMVDVDTVEMIAVADPINGVVIAVASNRLLANRRPIRSKEGDYVIRHTTRASPTM